MDEKLRFTRGTKVEVLNMKDQPFGSWRCAEIVSGDGRTCMIRYYSSNSAAMKNTLGRVSHKFVRPYQPLLDISRTWIPGEVVEVFDKFSWKIWNISRALGGNYFLIRLRGLSQVLRASSSNIRARKSWQNKQWTLIVPGSITFDGMNGSRCREVMTRELNFSSVRRRRACCGRDLQHSRGAAIPKTRKRGSLYFDPESEEEHYKGIAILPPARLSSESNDEGRRIQSSISSCSIISSPGCSEPPPPDDILSAAHSRDAGSSCYGNCRPGNEEVDAEVHKMELCAYHCMMEALCASVPLFFGTGITGNKSSYDTKYLERRTPL